MMPPDNNLESDVEDNLVEVDEMKFIEGNVMETNSDNEREEYREELMVTVVPMSEIRSKVTDEVVMIWMILQDFPNIFLELCLAVKVKSVFADKDEEGRERN